MTGNDAPQCLGRVVARVLRLLLALSCGLLLGAASFQHVWTASQHTCDRPTSLLLSQSPVLVPGPAVTHSSGPPVGRGNNTLSVALSGFAAEGAAGAADDIAVIGRQRDTAVAKGWLGHEVLDIPKWSPVKNAAWVNGIIQKAQRVHIAPPETKANLWDAVNNRTTVFGRELGQLFDAGYTRSGDYLLPPG